MEDNHKILKAIAPAAIGTVIGTLSVLAY